MSQNILRTSFKYVSPKGKKISVLSCISSLSRGLRFEEAPDYMYLRQLFRILFRTLNHQYDYTFDWTMLKQKAAASASAANAATASGAVAGTNPPPMSGGR